jgi:hypothetical protein
MRDEQEEVFKVGLALKRAWEIGLSSISGVTSSL